MIDGKPETMDHLKIAADLLRLSPYVEGNAAHADSRETMRLGAIAIRQLHDELAMAKKVAAERASGDPAVRDLLLHYFGTTEPEFLKDAFEDLLGDY